MLVINHKWTTNLIIKMELPKEGGLRFKFLSKNFIKTQTSIQGSAKCKMEHQT